MVSTKQKVVTPVLAAFLCGLTTTILAVITGLVAIGLSVLAGLIVGIVYGMLSGWYGIYDLEDSAQVGCLIVDCTWSLPNTVFGLVIGGPLYAIFGAVSAPESFKKTWLVFLPTGSGSFGRNVLQTLGTINLGGAGAHERVHLIQARIFGPFYLVLQGSSYVVNTLLQGLWCATLGWVLKVTGVRQKLALQASSDSAVQGGWGWIYRFTIFELWAYATE